MNLFAREQGERIEGSLSYRTNLFAESSMRRLLGNFENLLREVVRGAERPLGELALLGGEEREQVVVGWNRTEVEYPRGSVAELFLEQARRRPEATAVECGGEKLSYGELNRRANQLGHYLRKMGVGPEVRVGICVERSLEMIVGLLGIVKAGGAYVPLDPGYPAERLKYMLEDSQAAVLLARKEMVDRLPEF